jgi:small conductance mechanosensitive channel
MSIQSENLTHLLASGILVVTLTALGLITLHLAGRRALAWAQSLSQVRAARRQQLVTLIHIVQWSLVVLLVGSAVLMLLGTFGVDITPLLASAGVAGLAVSLGAQSLIKDLIGGVLVIIENQYAVGDAITVGNVSGEVERITLRSTQVRARNGDLYTVPNGEVRILANETRGWSRALVELGVAYEEDLERALDVLGASAEAFAQDPAFEASLLEVPQVLGPMRLGNSAVILQVAVKTEPGKQWEIGRELRKRLLAACEREGVSLPYPRQEVWVRNPERQGMVSHERSQDELGGEQIGGA